MNTSYQYQYQCSFSKFHDLINDQIESDASHDFDVISHESCSYDDPGKGLQVDVEQVVGKIFGSNQVKKLSRKQIRFYRDIKA